ncbi:MAG: hypothetical protein QOE59_1229 [Actinomycetota bacterium]|jgi:hypothetical protein|nr:hypothetical protein [Actinomycetota bacterium]
MRSVRAIREVRMSEGYASIALTDEVRAAEARRVEAVGVGVRVQAAERLDCLRYR